MLERSLYLPLYTGANLEGWGLYRIGDGTWGKNPCDIGGCAPDGEGVALEVKVVARDQSLIKPLPWRKFTDHQLKWLEFFAKQPLSLSLVGLYSEASKELTIYHIIAPDFLAEPAQFFPRVTLTLSRPGYYSGWDNILKARDRRSLTDALKRI